MNNISLRTKLIVFILFIIIATSGCITLFSYNAAEKAILKQSEKATTAYLNQVSKRLDTFLENIHRGTTSIAFNKDLIYTLSRVNISSSVYSDEYIKSLQRNMDLIATFANINRFFYSISIFDLNNNLKISSKGSKERIDQHSDDYLLIEKFYGKNKEFPSFNWIETREITDNHNKRKVLTFLLPVRSDVVSNCIILVNVKEEDVSRIFSETDYISAATIYLVNKNNIIISAKDKGLIGKVVADIPKPSGKASSSPLVDDIRGERCLVTYMKSSYIDWTFYSVIPIKALMKDNVNALKNTFILICGVTIAIIFLISILLNMIIYKPISLLIHTVKHNDNDIDNIGVHNTRKDEIGFLFNSFQDILQEKKSLLKSVYDQKLLLKDAEIRLLHSQINSHFLYNTLDSVIWMAKAKDFQKIITIVNAMVTFFRISLDRGNKLITVTKAKEQIASYFEIQKIRYSDRLVVEINISSAIEEYRILKLLLQPVVENSVQHGIEKKIGQGLIRVTGLEEEGVLKFIIEDNGVGITRDKLLEVNRIINDEEQDVQDFYALQNINRRIRLFYGEKYGLSIDSQEGAGTTVTIQIPII